MSDYATECPIYKPSRFFNGQSVKSFNYPAFIHLTFAVQ